jgi:hypothetical protein
VGRRSPRAGQRPLGTHPTWPSAVAPFARPNPPPSPPRPRPLHQPHAFLYPTRESRGAVKVFNSAHPVGKRILAPTV